MFSVSISPSILQHIGKISRVRFSPNYATVSFPKMAVEIRVIFLLALLS
jgi:hypothetical protein